MKSKYIEKVEQLQIKKSYPTFRPGDSITVNAWVKEGNKKRIQAFKGFVLSLKKRGLNSSFVARKGNYGYGVEKTFQTYSPVINDIKIEKRGKVRQSKLYYIRKLKGRASRIREKI
jgi:large subunit ribosomal protein L19